MALKIARVMAPRLSHPNAAKRGASEQPGMELRLVSRALNEAVEATAQFFKTQRVVACCGDRFTPVSYTHLRAHETLMNLVCRLLLEKKK